MSLDKPIIEAIERLKESPIGREIREDLRTPANLVLRSYYELYKELKGQERNTSNHDKFENFDELQAHLVEILQAREITHADSDQLLNQLVRIESVHKVRDVKQLKKTRLAPTDNSKEYNKHCYGLFFPGFEHIPVAVVYTAFQNLPERDGHTDYQALPGDITAVRDTDVSKVSSNPNTMVFYSVSNPNYEFHNQWFPELSGMPVGNIVISKAVEASSPLYEDDVLLEKNIRTYTTLSPLRSDKHSFESWLEKKGGYDNIVAILKDKGNGPIKDLSADDKPKIIDTIEELALEYLLTMQDDVEQFHMRSGAIIGGIRVNLNPEAGQDKVMVNYVRGVGNTKERGDAFNDNGEVQIARYIIDDLEKHTGAIERLGALTSHLKNIDNEIVAYQGGK